MFAVNFKAHVNAVRAFLPLLAPRSSIVLTSSVGGPYAVWRRHLAYLTSKAALAKAVEALAADLIDREIRVNGVAPGGMSKELEGLPKLGAPAAPPEAVARVIIWLLTDEAAWVNGAVIPVDGGRRLVA
ncbi:MAG: SDR family oxidoreductase [Pyrobaculum sp.]